MKGASNSAYYEACKRRNTAAPDARRWRGSCTSDQREQWERERVELSQEQQLPLDFAQHWPSLAALLTEQLQLLDEGYPANPHLEIREDQFHLARPDRFPVSPSAHALRNRLRQMLQRRHLSDLLLETQRWTGFLHAFTRLASGRPITATDTPVQIALLAALIAEGCNIGLRDMAVVGPGLSFDQLEEVYATYIREETLAQATATSEP